jgi:hypothetical protein
MSSDDERFEALVRDAFHEEAPVLPVRITAAELRARAGARRGRWSLLMTSRSWLGALVPIAVLVAVVAILTVGPLGSTPVGGTAAPSPLAPSVAPGTSTAATATPTLRPTPAPPTIDLGASGDLVLVSFADPATIRVTSVGGAGERVLFETAMPAADVPTGDVAVSRDGLLAVGVQDMAAQGDGPLTWLFDMRDPRDPGQLLPGAEPAFGPDGDLVTIGRAGSSARTVQHYTFGPDGGVEGRSDVSPPAGGAVLSVFTADGRGLFAYRDRDPRSAAILGWDGSLVDRAPGDAPWFATGIERPRGARGDWLFGVTWTFADGSTERLRLPDGVNMHGTAWTRTGDTAVFVSAARGRWALYAIDADDRSTIRRLGALPGPDVRITGMTDDAVIVTLASGESIAVALDGSGTIGGRHDGMPALIVP